jgi:two-component system, NarL family, sensor histidine kinase DegS
MKITALDRVPALTERTSSIREDERRRLARELHDGPAQALAAALFGLDLAVTAIDRAPGTAREELLSARALVRDALDDVRGLMAGLRPRLLEERGLVVALQSLVGAPPLWGPAVTFEARGIDGLDRLPPDIELALFRIAQEAVSNARRHGGASDVRVTLEVRPDVVVLGVLDDGHGFVPELALRSSRHGEGLPGMRERAVQLGGELSIESAPGFGTRVSVSVPLEGTRHAMVGG